MSISATAAAAVPFGRRIKRFMSDYPLVPLIVLLILLVIVLQILQPRHRQPALDRQHGQVRDPAGACSPAARR